MPSPLLRASAIWELWLCVSRYGYDSLMIVSHFRPQSRGALDPISQRCKKISTFAIIFFQVVWYFHGLPDYVPSLLPRARLYESVKAHGKSMSGVGWDLNQECHFKRSLRYISWELCYFVNVTQHLQTYENACIAKHARSCQLGGSKSQHSVAGSMRGTVIYSHSWVIRDHLCNILWPTMSFLPQADVPWACTGISVHQGCYSYPH